MSCVHVIGVATTRFARHPDKSHKELAREAVQGALADVGQGISEQVGAIHFGSCTLHAWGQANVGGNVVLGGLVDEGVLPAGAPIFNVEGGCATGAMAVHGARNAIAAGDCDFALAVGVDKTFMPHDLAAMKGLFEGAMDQLDPQVWQADLEAAAAEHGLPYAPHPMRITLLDVCGLQLAFHVKRWQTTPAQIAASAAKNHDHGALNDNAQYRKPMTIEQVLADKPIVGELTRAMCAPISDGAAAVVLCSEAGLARLEPSVRARAVLLEASVVAAGRRRAIDATPVTQIAAERAYAAAGVGPADIDIAEVHDATSFAEIAASEALGFCEPGGGGAYIASGAAALGGLRPTNLSGGLVSKGHPLAATGIAMLHELVTQLRGEAGARQANNPKRALLHNAGGLVSFDEAACVVQIVRGR
jgi:acetyl-CoA acetyltransferase